MAKVSKADRKAESDLLKPSLLRFSTTADHCCPGSAGNAADAGANEKVTTKKDRACIGCMVGNIEVDFL